MLTLTWVISGTFSMDPFGFLADRPTDERVRLAGDPIPWSEVRASLAAIQASPPPGNIVLLADRADRRPALLARDGHGRRRPSPRRGRSSGPRHARRI